MGGLTYSISNAQLSYAGASLSMTINASSGNGDCLNNNTSGCLSTAWKGAIPIGVYTIFASDISAPGVLRSMVRRTTGDWGSWRVRLHPNGHNAHGRSNFFLHGGDIEGSAGCIDIGGGIFGNGDTKMLKTIIEASRVIELQVIE